MDRIGDVLGRDTHALLATHPLAVIALAIFAEELGIPYETFPRGHNGYRFRPRATAERLHQVLAGQVCCPGTLVTRAWTCNLFRHGPLRRVRARPAG